MFRAHTTTAPAADAAGAGDRSVQAVDTLVLDDHADTAAETAPAGHGSVPPGDTAGADTSPGPGRRRSFLRWTAAGTVAAACLSAVAIAAWPASAADRARDDGERFGAAVAQLESAQTAGEVDAALADLHAAASDTRVHAGEAVSEQAADQADALSRAVDGFAGSRTADDGFEYDVYQAELDWALDDLERQAEDFRAEGPEVREAFWDGYDTGRSGS